MASLHPHDLLEKTQGLTQCHFQPQNGYKMASLHPHDLLEMTQGLTQCHFQPQNGYSLLESFHVDARLLLCHNHYIHLGRLIYNQN